MESPCNFCSFSLKGARKARNRLTFLLRKSGDKLKGINFETRLIKGLVIIDRLERKGGWISEDVVWVTIKFT